MANYWDTYNPGLLAGQDYWEDFTPEAPTETGVVGAVTGNRFQPWEQGYHKMAGLVDDSGQYDAWYDPDPPLETSVPDWAKSEGYENWKNKIALETNNNNQNTGDGTYIGPEGVEGAGRIENSIVDAIQRQQGSDVNLDLKSIKDWTSSIDWGNVALAGISGNPLMVGMALFNNKIDATLQSVFDLFKSDTDTESGGEPLGEKAAMDAASAGQTDGSFSAL